MPTKSRKTYKAWDAGDNIAIHHNTIARRYTFVVVSTEAGVPDSRAAEIVHVDLHAEVYSQVVSSQHCQCASHAMTGDVD